MIIPGDPCSSISVVAPSTKNNRIEMMRKYSSTMEKVVHFSLRLLLECLGLKCPGAIVMKGDASVT